MAKKYPTIHKSVKGFMHGGDYNPDQWLRYPDILEEDLRLMKLAKCNTFSINIFSWAAIEPEEGNYSFEWLDKIMDDLAENGSHVILATPSGSRPAWLSQKYPEVLRVESNRVRNLHGLRHNHCFTSPVYREKTAALNRMLAERYKDHPALIMWHVSNEYGGECHCDLCQDAFRSWLKQKYKTLDHLNHAWWTGFWSHTFTDWDQIESPAPHGEYQVHGHNLDWKRFVTDQTIDFYKNEIVPLREITPDIPVTTNFMGDYPKMGPYLGLNYQRFAQEVDVVTWDSYPAWHSSYQENWELARDVAFVHDLFRSLKGGQPFLILESTPSLVNWHTINRAKRPGMHMLSSMQSIAHGSDSVMYFQWRKGRGASEKFHGAVVDHAGHEHTRVFREVTEVGHVLEKIQDVVGTAVQAEVAIIYDWENQWAIDDAQALKRENKEYIKTCQQHYQAFWKKGVPVDIISMDQDVSDYKLVIAPMLYMVRPGVAERIEQFVEDGGTFVATYWSGIVDENDLCFLGGFPGPLRNVLGIWVEEIDSLYETQFNEVQFIDTETANGAAVYAARDYCEVIHAEQAEVLAEFRHDFYKGSPAVTKNRIGSGSAYYLASRNSAKFQDDFYQRLMDELGILPPLLDIPKKVSVQKRSDGVHDYLFVMNFDDSAQQIELIEGQTHTNLLTDQEMSGKIELEGYGVVVLKSSQ
ncbi:beta-galactosidase [Radiobacillus deserti]|uniref:Beta-galactosidase n=1 Tax=Radiobacillus deserti TaxID=2594883 RepID=A0A516KKK0_9BACI|nr:beta-galactosidase [Radiobacillus deserti]QDP41924.1 beta-galactosidase [Radiobacillus deserti]